jgi:hypothetical protein
MVFEACCRLIRFAFLRQSYGFLDQLWSSHLLSFPDDRGSDFGSFLLPLGRAAQLAIDLGCSGLAYAGGLSSAGGAVAATISTLWMGHFMSRTIT